MPRTRGGGEIRSPSRQWQPPAAFLRSQRGCGTDRGLRFTTDATAGTTDGENAFAGGASDALPSIPPIAPSYPQAEFDPETSLPEICLPPGGPELEQGLASRGVYLDHLAAVQPCQAQAPDDRLAPAIEAVRNAENRREPDDSSTLLGVEFFEIFVSELGRRSPMEACNRCDPSHFFALETGQRAVQDQVV
jgi:hypothetical protein